MKKLTLRQHMVNESIKNIETIADYIDTSKDFDATITKYASKIISPQTASLDILETGCSTGEMTKDLINYAKSVSVVEGSKQYAECVRKKFGKKLTNLDICLFEDYLPTCKFEGIVISGCLHHMKSPKSFLQIMKSWLLPNGVAWITVPNITSFHRQLGVKMNLIDSPSCASERNLKFSQPGRFTMRSMNDLLTDTGFQIIDSFGFFLKPFHHELMNKLSLEGILTDQVLDGLYLMGKEHQQLACQLYFKVKT